jgi:hypothetical protein
VRLYLSIVLVLLAAPGLALTPASRYGIKYSAGDTVVVEGTLRVVADSLFYGDRQVGNIVWQDSAKVAVDSLIATAVVADSAAIPRLKGNVTLVDGNFLPLTNATQNLGAAITAWDTTFTKTLIAEADMPFADSSDDVAKIRAIRGSGKLNPRGMEIVDDYTMPAEIMLLHQAGEWVTAIDGKPYFDVTAAIGLSYGAIRQLADEVDAIKKEIAGDFGGVPLGAVVVLLIAAVAALEAQVLSLKKRVDELEKPTIKEE